MASIRVTQEGFEAAPGVVRQVVSLLRELGEEARDAGDPDEASLVAAWKRHGAAMRVFVARTAGGEIAGVSTVVEAFALYAGGCYGIINEMYVSPAARGQGAGRALIDAVKAHGRSRGWSRIDVTAPEAPRWERTRRFYEREGFTFAGPKLKFLLAGTGPADGAGTPRSVDSPPSEG